MTNATAIQDRPSPSLPTGASSGKFAMWLFLVSDAMGFGSLIVTYAVLRHVHPDWPNPAHVLNIPLTAFNTLVLIFSARTMAAALSAAQRGDQTGLTKSLRYTIIGGVLFLGIQAYEYTHLLHDGVSLYANLFGATFFAMTGFHGLHVLAGVIYLTCIWWAAARGHYSASHYSPVEIAGLYWYFVDLVWILIFTFVYLI